MQVDDDDSGVLELDEFLILLIKAVCGRLQAVHALAECIRSDVTQHLQGFGNQEEEGDRASTVGIMQSAGSKAADPTWARSGQSRIQHRSCAKRAGPRPVLASQCILRSIFVWRALGELKKVGYDCAALREACQESLCRVSHESKRHKCPNKAGFTAADLMDVCTVRRIWHSKRCRLADRAQRIA